MLDIAFVGKPVLGKSFVHHYYYARYKYISQSIIVRNIIGLKEIFYCIRSGNPDHSEEGNKIRQTTTLPKTLKKIRSLPCTPTITFIDNNP